MTDLIHKPVMVAEVLDALGPRAGGRYADGTVGLGSTAFALLERSAPNGWVFGCDRDGAALEVAARRLAPFAGRFELRQMNFAGLASWIEPGSCDGVLLDLGVNSTQLDSADRGFSFQQDGPLDMRLNPLEGVSASAICNEASADELMKIFREYADEPHARRIALAIARARRDAPFTRTAQLANLVEQVNPRRGARTHPATRVFQSLRIAVNDELGSLRAGLPAALQVLKPGGRLAVISFHSAEDRIAKEFGRVASRDYVQPCDTDIPELRQPRTPLVRLVTRKPIRPTADEIASNPRARSAQLRVFEKAQPQSNQTP